MNDHVSIHVHDGVASLTFQRPEKRNAITAQMWEAMITGLEALHGDGGVRALVLRGSGGYFSAGADLGSVKNSDGSESLEFRALAHQGITAVRDFPAATAALIEGPCMGAGCSLALAVDVRFARPDARFAVPAVRYGIQFDEPSIRRMVDLMGSGQALRILLSGSVVDGSAAEAIGLVDICSQDAASLCDDYLATVAEALPDAVAATRRTVRSLVLGLPLRTGEGSSHADAVTAR